MNRLYVAVLAIPLALSCERGVLYDQNRPAPNQGAAVEMGIPATNVCRINSIHAGMLGLYDSLKDYADNSGVVDLPAIKRVYTQAESELDHHYDALMECSRLADLRQPVKARMRYQAAEYHALEAMLWMSEAVTRTDENNL